MQANMAEEGKLLKALGGLLMAIGKLDVQAEGTATAASEAALRLHQVNAATESAATTAAANRRNQLLLLQHQGAQVVQQRLRETDNEVWQARHMRSVVVV